MTRNQAYEILISLIHNQNLVKHHLACEAAMKGIYDYLSKKQNFRTGKNDEEKWGIVGLLHDADYELTKEKPEKHTLVLEEKIGDMLPEDIMHAIKSHNYKYTKVTPVSLMDWAIVACDELTGLIIAAALVHPDRKLKSINTEFVLKRFNEKSFARGADREAIRMCEEHLGIPLGKFVLLVLTAMQKIAPELGL